MMTLTAPTLWGIDGHLQGEENALQGRLPFFTFDNRIYAARLANWSFEDDSLQLLSRAAANQRGVALPFAQHVTVTPDRLVVVVGPKFAHDCRALGLDIPAPDARSEDGFEVRMMPLTEYEQFATRLATQARSMFDKQLRANGDLTEFGKIALNVLHNSGAADPRSKFIRSIAAARLACEPDAVRRLSKMAQIRLRTNGDSLKADVEQYLSDVFSDPRRAAVPSDVAHATISLELIKADLEKIVRAEFSTFLKDQSFPSAPPLLTGSRFTETGTPIYGNQFGAIAQPMQRVAKNDPLMQPLEIGNA